MVGGQGGGNRGGYYDIQSCFKANSTQEKYFGSGFLLLSISAHMDQSKVPVASQGWLAFFAAPDKGLINEYDLILSQ